MACVLGIEYPCNECRMCTKDKEENLLILPTKKKWFDMVLSGEKPEEYREIKPYWDVRIAKWLAIKPTKENIEEIKEVLRQGNLSWIPSLEAKFINGYGSSRPSFVADCDVSIGTGREEWGAEPGKEYYVIHIKAIQNGSSCAGTIKNI